MPAGGITDAQISNLLTPTTATANDNIFSPSYITSNSCFTYADHSLAGVYVAASIGSANPNLVTVGFAGSITTCMDYAVDEMSISGTQTVSLWTQDWGTSSGTSITATAPATRLLGNAANSGKIWAPAVAPLDKLTAANLAAGTLDVYNHGAPKMV